MIEVAGFDYRDQLSQACFTIQIVLTLNAFKQKENNRLEEKQVIFQENTSTNFPEAAERK